MRQLAYEIAWGIGCRYHEYVQSVDIEQFADDVAYVKHLQERQKAASARRGPRPL